MQNSEFSSLVSAERLSVIPCVYPWRDGQAELTCGFLLLLTYSISQYYSDCAIAGQHDGHLPFWLPAFVKSILYYLLYVLLVDGE